MKSIKTRIAAGATILGLGGLTGLALSASHQKASQPVAAKPLVRTKVIRQTIHVVKHIKPKHPVGGPPVASAAFGAAAGAAGGTGGGSVATGSSSVGSAPTSSGSAPVVTHTSGGGGGGKGGAVVTHASGGGEHEGGGHGD